MDDINTEENNLPIIETSKEPSIRSQNEPNKKSPTASINTSLYTSSPNSRLSPSRQGSPPRKMTLDSPPKASIHTSSIKSERSQIGSLSRNSHEKRRSKSPSLKSEHGNNNNIETVTNVPNLSVQSAKGKKISKSPSIKSQNVEDNIQETISHLQPQGKKISKYVDELTETVKELTESLELSQSPALNSNINKITNMSKILTNEANALRESIKNLSEDISRTKQELCAVKEEDVNFPYHLFLIELIINKIHMKCECFEFNYDNLVISATFLGKLPIILYDSSYGKINNFNKLNVGKSTLFAMTYDKICCIKEFVIHLQITKQPPCSSCITKIAETYMDYSIEFASLREELCKKWTNEQPNDNIVCTTSTPLSKSMFYLSCCNNDQSDPIGMIEITTRMSFLGKEITTAFNATSKPHGTSCLLKGDQGMSLYSCQKVEMDGHGKILLDEDVITRQESPSSTRRTASPVSHYSSGQESLKRTVLPHHLYKQQRDDIQKYDEIFTKMNENELKIKVPKTTKVERSGKYETIQDLCTCENPLNSGGDQIQFELPQDVYPSKSQNIYTSNLKYTYKKCDAVSDKKDKKIINVTPSNCPAPINIEKQIHPLKDVFILKIGKKLETKDKKTDLEIELVTPKVPSEKPVEINQVSQQCSTGKLEDKSQKTDKKKPKKGKSKTNLSKKKDKKSKKGKKSKTKK